MAQETIRHDLATHISWRIARAHEHNALQSDPLLVRLAIEAVLLSHLPQECDHDLSAVLITRG